MREDSVIVDKILLTTSTSFTFPDNTVIGPGECARGSANPPAPVVSVSRSGSDVSISWNTGAIGTLQEAATIGGAWQNAAGTGNPRVVQPGGATKFYRVAIP